MTECDHGYPATELHRCAFCKHTTQPISKSMQTIAGDWATAAKHAIWELASSGRPFTSEDVTNLVGLPNDSRANRNNAVGAIIQGVARQYGLKRVDMTKARNPQSHGRLLTVWQGKGSR